MAQQRRPPARPAFSTATPLHLAAHRQPQRHCDRRRVGATAVVILGGSAGVGLEAANHLHANGVQPTTFSRRTGHDLRDPDVARAVLRDARGGVGVSVGAGRRTSTRDDELALYESVVAGLCAATADDAGAVGLVVAVARNLILSDVRAMLQRQAGDSTPRFDWVIVRPGPLVDVDARRRLSLDAESLLVTEDPRCNGLVSRRAAGAVVAGLLLGRVPREQVVGLTLGVFDRNRMQSMPTGVVEIGSRKLWTAIEST